MPPVELFILPATMEPALKEFALADPRRTGDAWVRSTNPDMAISAGDMVIAELPDDRVSDAGADSSNVSPDFTLMSVADVMLRFPADPPFPVTAGTLSVPVMVPPVKGTNSLLRLIGEQAHPVPFH